MKPATCDRAASLTAEFEPVAHRVAALLYTKRRPVAVTLDELEAEALVGVWEAAKRLVAGKVVKPGRLTNFMAGAARNGARRHLRWARRRGIFNTPHRNRLTVSSASACPDDPNLDKIPDARPEPQVTDPDELPILLAPLTPREKVLVRLHIASVPFRAIGEAVGLSESGAHLAYHAALAKLRAAFPDLERQLAG